MCGSLVTVFSIFGVFSDVAPDDQQPLEASEGGNPEQKSPNATTVPQVTLFLYPEMTCAAFRLY